MAKRIDLNVKEISRLYKSGMSSCAIGRKFGVDHNTVFNRLKEAGVKRRAWKISLDANEVERLHKSGLSMRDIGKELGASTNAVSKCLYREGLASIGNRHASKIGEKAANETYRDKSWLTNEYVVFGKTQMEIANELGVSNATICEWMQRNGISARPREETAISWAHHVDLSEQAKSFINGLLLGDGHMNSYSPITAGYGHTDKHYEYIVWLIEKLRLFNIQSSEITKRDGSTRGHEFTSYSMYTRNYAEFYDIWGMWYPHGKKIVPPSLNLDQIASARWYEGDGCLNHNPRGRVSIKLSTNGFSKYCVLMLIDKLKGIGLSGTYQPSNNTIRLNHENTLKFLDYIGPCPEEIWNCYGYKWDLTRTKKEWEAEYA